MITYERIEEYFEKEFLEVLLSGRGSDTSKENKIFIEIVNTYLKENPFSLELKNILSYKKELSCKLIDIYQANPKLTPLLEKERNIMSVVLSKDPQEFLRNNLSPIEILEYIECVSKNKILDDEKNFVYEFKNINMFSKREKLYVDIMEREMNRILDKKFSNEFKNPHSKELVSKKISKYLAIVSLNINDSRAIKLMLQSFIQEFVNVDDKKKHKIVINAFKDINILTAQTLSKYLSEEEMEKINILPVIENALLKGDVNVALALSLFDKKNEPFITRTIVNNIVNLGLENRVINVPAYREYSQIESIKNIVDKVIVKNELNKQKKALEVFMNGEEELGINDTGERVFYLNSHRLLDISERTTNVNISKLSTENFQIIPNKNNYIILIKTQHGELLTEKDVSMTLARTVYAFKNKEFTLKDNSRFIENVLRSILLEKLTALKDSQSDAQEKNQNVVRKKL